LAPPYYSQRAVFASPPSAYLQSTELQNLKYTTSIRKIRRMDSF